MSVDVLQEKIRKLKNPLVVDLALSSGDLPPNYADGAAGYARFCMDMLRALKGVVPGVRVGFTAFAMLGPEGLSALSGTLRAAKELGFYVVLEGPYLLSPMMASSAAQAIFGKDSLYPCDGLIVGIYPGSDCLKPFLPYVREGKKDLFAVVRTSNKSAPELQDLLTGSRLVHAAAADLINRFGQNDVEKCGYSRVSILAGANSAGSLQSLRTKYPGMFILVDDMDYTGCNAKICAAAFDRLGHGAAVCAGPGVTMAWKQAEHDGADCMEQAVAAAERLKKNITRYCTIL